MLNELRVAAWDRGVHDIDSVDACFLPRRELLRQWATPSGASSDFIATPNS